MTLQQLRYVIEVAACGSFNAAAQKLYVVQSTLSMSIKDLEAELGILIFTRSNRGLSLTSEGMVFLGYARQVVEQVDLLEDHYTAREHTSFNRLSISTQHYAFSVHAFVNMTDAFDADRYDITLRETRTSEIIDDVREFRSELGIIYLSSYNERIITRLLEESLLSFTELFRASSHVFVGETHPLAHRKSIKLSELDKYPRLSFEQGTTNSFYFFEEPFASLPHAKNITFSDRGTLTNLLIAGSGYTLSTGILSNEMQRGIVSIPLEESEDMRVGYIMRKDRKPSKLLERYILELKTLINKSRQVKHP